ncbi:L-histidine N(alpha)-methyltransferase [Paracraurococcus lichenis]|uniref:L-histidine N(Alpha)-methyltransferase n=1 Tax=Paracraurococcus lichenis TaxID=3064888 RepID=A0ABT9DSV8_9PROT|nr:L-histidine N(alpha)-methyltransferase [Paracraurococcus sp. LOR1-02]MDO9706977.1 L-histidine N(alpha)-methyltransferase [Paracraurococcus sp. LOR1-02]
MSGTTEASQRAALLADAVSGLSASPKTLPCKWLYDAEGARLFEEITRLPEYYPTRTEVAILTGQAEAIAEAIGPGAAVVEFGPGDGAKAELLLAALRAPACYVPVDIAPEWLEGAASRIAAARPGLPVLPVVADFTQPFALPRRLGTAPRLGFFPGSTIGNFEPAEATAFLRRARETLGAGSRMLLGADLVKDRAVLEAAYDDAAGVTAAFDLNLLRRLNREAGADFDLAGFRHRAVWNTERERVEMHLVSLRPQRVRLGGREFAFAEGETIHTESSHKYRPERFPALAAAAGWRAAAMWTDPARLFSVWLLEG